MLHWKSLFQPLKDSAMLGFIYDYNKTKDLKGITVTAVNEEISAVLEQALRGTGLRRK